VSFDVPEPVTEVGTKVAFVRLGKPTMLKVTGDENPPFVVTVIV
jgi:hypothetical protein